MILCIDSHIFIWGIKKQATDGQENMIEKAEYLFQWADDNKHKIMIPTVVIAEVLAPEPIELYPYYMDIINKNFIVAQYDLRAATIYAQILNNKIGNLKIKAKQLDIKREVMKIDHLILSCALVNGASFIYTVDKGLIAFSEGILETKDLPNPPLKQPDLFTSF